MILTPSKTEIAIQRVRSGLEKHLLLGKSLKIELRAADMHFSGVDDVVIVELTDDHYHVTEEINIDFVISGEPPFYEISTIQSARLEALLGGISRRLVSELACLKYIRQL